MPNSYTSDYAASSKKSYTSDYAASSKPKSKSTRPKNVNKNIKVSQSEIDSIKKMGMKKALSSAKTGSSSFGEGVRRLYGETRYQNAIYTPKASPGPIGSASNVREGRSTNMSPMSSSANTRENRMPAKAKATRPMGESTRSTKSTAKAKSKNVAGFKPGSIGAKAIGSFKKAYLGK